MLRINGKPVAAVNQSVSRYLAEQGFNAARVAVEINGNVVPKRLYDETLFRKGDTVEIVSFVGGG